MKWLLPKRNRTKRQSGVDSERSAATRWNFAKYDESTGQVYLETTAAIQTSDDRNWARDGRLVREADYRDDVDYEEHVKRFGIGDDPENHQRHLHRFKNSRVRGFKGARSLQDATIECVLENISDITLDGIECLPISIVRRIWHAVNRRCSRCFNTWSIFSKILQQDDTLSLGLLRYHQLIKAPSCPLKVYTSPLTSKSYEFITSLSIAVVVPLPELVKLSNITNLGVLEVINTRGSENITVGDRLIRSWYLAAVNEGAFPILRILKLWNHEGLTSKSLPYLNGFPALALYDVQGCSIKLNAKVEAARLGWQATLDTNMLGLLEKACVERSALMWANFGNEGISSKEFDSERLWHGAKVRWIPRGDIAAFLTRPRVPTQETFDASQTNHIPKDAEKVPLKFQDRRKNSATQPHSKDLVETWDIPSYKAFARIGELRNDTDLVRAGVRVGDQAVVGNELVNSVPMASLRLWESPCWLESSSTKVLSKSLSSDGYCNASATPLSYDWKEKPQLATSTLRGLAFFRIKTNPPAQNQSQDPVEAVERDKAGSDSTLTRPLHSKRPASGIARNKKRRLDDVLSSFL